LCSAVVTHGPDRVAFRRLYLSTEFRQKSPTEQPGNRGTKLKDTVASKRLVATDLHGAIVLQFLRCAPVSPA